MNNPLFILVLGGHGFIGSAIVKELQRHGHKVLIGTRAKHRHLRPGERRVAFQSMKAEDWLNSIKDVHVVINAVGILRERWGESYEQVHHHAVKELANACFQGDVKLVHISALGLNNPVRSRFLSSKRRGEQAIKKSGAQWHIVRPSLLEGRGGYGAKWFRRVADWPIHITPATAKGYLAPLPVRVLAKQIVSHLLVKNGPRTLELGGPREYRVHEYLQALRGSKPILHLRVPGFLARLFSHLFDLLHLTPFSFGHYELMRFDNLPNLELHKRNCRSHGNG